MTEDWVHPEVTHGEARWQRNGVASVEAEGGEVQKGRSPWVNAKSCHGAEKLQEASRPVDKTLPRPRDRGVRGSWDENSLLRWAGRFQTHSQVQGGDHLWEVERGGVQPAPQAFGFCD